MLDLANLERGELLYEALIHAIHPRAACDWSPVYTAANGPVDVFHLAVTVENHTVMLPTISFAVLETLATDGDPKIEQEVRQVMAAFD